MTEYQRLVDEIRSFLHGSDQTLTDPVRELAAGYADACREINRRLRRCEEFLKAGLRSEALHYAQAAPALLDLVAVLDFPEREEWQAVAVTYGLAPPPKLLLDTAEALNRAYAEEKPLENLLRNHRRQALARSPLPARLATMRQIALLDAGNPVWTDDIAEFEKARFQQMQAEVDQAIARNDPAAVAVLWDEIDKNQWQVAPPMKLVQTMGRWSLENLAIDLNAAFALRDLPRLLRLRDQWSALTRRIALPAGDPIWHSVNRALAWLTEQEKQQAEEQKFQVAVHHLEHALAHNGTAREELDRLAFEVQRHGRPIPPLVKQRYQARARELKHARAWREKLILTVTFSAGIFLLVGLAVYLRHSAAQGRKAAAVQKLQLFLDKGQPADFRQFLTELMHSDPSTAASPEVLELKKKLEAREKGGSPRARDGPGGAGEK